MSALRAELPDRRTRSTGFPRWCASRARSSGSRTCSSSPRPARPACSANGTALFRTGDRVRLLLPRRERHLLPERRARRRGRPPPPDEALPPDRGGRGLGAHRGHRRHRAASSPRSRCRSRRAGSSRSSSAATSCRRVRLQRVAEARGGARPRVRRVGLRAPHDRRRCRGRRHDLAVVPHRRRFGVAVHGHRASATRR